MNDKANQILGKIVACRAEIAVINRNCVESGMSDHDTKKAAKLYKTLARLENDLNEERKKGRRPRRRH